MALLFNLENSSLGVGFNQCYARIESFTGNKLRVAFDVAFYANPQSAADAKQGKAREVELRRYEVPFASEMGDNLLAYLYDHLKATSEFQSAQDV